MGLKKIHGGKNTVRVNIFKTIYLFGIITTEASHPRVKVILESD